MCTYICMHTAVYINSWILKIENLKNESFHKYTLNTGLLTPVSPGSCPQVLSDSAASQPCHCQVTEGSSTADAPD